MADDDLIEAVNELGRMMRSVKRDVAAIKVATETPQGKGRLVCAWCGRVLVEQYPTEGDSHGICRGCLRSEIERLETEIGCVRGEMIVAHNTTLHLLDEITQRLPISVNGAVVLPAADAGD